LRKNKTLSLDEAAHLLLTGRTEMMVLTDADKEYLLQRFLEISSQPKQRYGRTDARILDDTKHLMLDKGLGLIPGFHLNPHYEKRGFMPDDPLTQVPDGIHTATGTQIECKKLGDNSDNLGFYSERWNHIFDNPQLVDYFALARTLATPDGDRYFYKFVCVFPRNVPHKPAQQPAYATLC